MINEELTKKEKEIFDFIKLSIELKGYPPTVREICSGVNLKSPSSVHGYLERLESKKYIHRTSMKTRAISINENYDNINIKKLETVEIPIIGEVTAGRPILALENIVETFSISRKIAKDKELFMLKVNGNSMINKGIFDGDYVLIERQSQAEDGEVILALIDDSATIKTYYKEDGVYKLKPENDNMDSIYTKELTVLGKVIGLYRNLI